MSEYSYLEIVLTLKHQPEEIESAYIIGAIDHSLKQVFGEIDKSTNMSYGKSFGKDKIIFATKEDHNIPSTIELPPSEPSPGLLLANGEINWNCPCLGGMATGPCGVEFREAFSCFHYSEADPKGSDCFDNFQAMQDCFSKYPTVYNQNLDDSDQDPEKIPMEESKPANEYVDPMQEETLNSDDKNDEKKTGTKAIEP